MDFISYILGVVTIPALVGGYVLFREVILPLVKKQNLLKKAKD